MSIILAVGDWEGRGRRIVSLRPNWVTQKDTIQWGGKKRGAGKKVKKKKGKKVGRKGRKEKIVSVFKTLGIKKNCQVHNKPIHIY